MTRTIPLFKRASGTHHGSIMVAADAQIGMHIGMHENYPTRGQLTEINKKIMLEQSSLHGATSATTTLHPGHRTICIGE